jgi:RNA polymerase sigma factor (sigma-70 family)
MTIATQHKPVPIQSHEYPGREIHVQYFHYQFTKIVANWTAHLQYNSWQITKNKQVAEDIVQEAFLALWQQRVKIIPENPVGWLIKVVANLSVRYIRDKNVQIRIHSDLSKVKNASCSDVEEYLIGKEQFTLLKHAFNQLPAQQKLVFHLSKEKGLKRAEIASCLQLSPNTVRMHLHRAVQYMKDNLVCISIFILFFTCNNIFFRESSTNEGFTEWFKKESLSSVTVTESIQKKEFPNYQNLLAAIATFVTNSMKQ